MTIFVVNVIKEEIGTNQGLKSVVKTLEKFIDGTLVAVKERDGNLVLFLKKARVAS